MRKRADILLVERGFFSSRARAQAAIAAGLVSVGGVALKKPSEEVAEDASIEAAAPHPVGVARRGQARRGARRVCARSLGPRLPRRRRLDRRLHRRALARGAAKVIAVDVGRGQFAPRLFADRRVVSLEGRTRGRSPPSVSPTRRTRS